MESKLNGFFKSKWFKYTLIAVVAAIIVNYVFFQGDDVEYVLAEATIGDIVQTVSVTGSIKADPSLDLHFQKTGTVNSIVVKEGETVAKGDLMATLENISLDLEVQSKQANLNYARANYNKTQAGAKFEEIQIAEADVSSAEAALQAAKVELDNTKSISDSNIELAKIIFEKSEKDFENTTALAEKELEKLNLAGNNTSTIALESAYRTIQNQLDVVFTAMQDALVMVENIIGVRGAGYFYLSGAIKSQLQTNYHRPAKEAYDEALELQSLAGSNPTDEEIDAIIFKALEAADGVSLLISQTGIALENIAFTRSDLADLIVGLNGQASALAVNILSVRETQKTILTLTTGSLQDIETLKLSYQLQIDQAEAVLKEAEFNLSQAKLNAEIADQNAIALVSLRQAAVDTSKATLSLRRSPARSVDLAPLAAQINQAEIALKQANKSLSDSRLIAPINGLITFIHGELGENISLTETSLTPFISIQADNLIIEANVPETDVVKLEVGDQVEMTIDAFDFTEKLNGEVVYLDPAETVIQGVIYYGIKTAFDIEDPRLKSGMTANLEIITDKKENVLIIPIRAIKFEDSIRYVEVLNNGGPKKITIQTGLESDQFVEVTDGLKKGDKIITFVK